MILINQSLMDFSKLYQDLSDKKFTDVEITLVDDHDKMTIFAHRNILACSSEYFYKLFTFNIESVQQKMFRITVCDSKIAYDIIMSFYGQTIDLDKYHSVCSHLFKLFRCRRFFCQENNPSLLYDLTIPHEHYGEFLQILEEFDIINDYKLMDCVKRNLPTNYPLDSFSREFILEMLKHSDRKLSVLDASGKYLIFDSYSGKLIEESQTKKKHYDKIISSNGSLICQTDGYDTVEIFDVTEKSEYINIKANHCVSYISISADKKMVAFCGLCGVSLWDIETSKPIWSIHVDGKRFTSATISPDNKFLVYYTDSKIYIHDIPANTVVKKIMGHRSIYVDIAISPDNKLLVSTDGDKINIWNMSNGDLLRVFNSNRHIRTIVFIQDNQIVCHDINNNISIWNTDVTMDTVDVSNPIIEFVCHGSFVHDITVSKDRKIAFYDSECTIKVLDLVDGSLVCTIHRDNCNYNDLYHIQFISSEMDEVDKRLDTYLKIEN